MIIQKLNNGESITMKDSNTLAQYKNSVLLFMSPNDILSLENETIEKIKQNSL